MLISLAGLPGTGKTTIARLVASRLGAVHLRLDTVEQALVDSGAHVHPVGPVGYHVCRALAADHLRQGLDVVADCVNPVAVTRDLWRDVALATGVGLLEVEVVCSDPARHRERVRTRTSGVPGMPQPTWDEVQAAEHDPWTRDHLVLDTATLTAEEAATALLGALGPRGQ